jgi:hypothetical protein
MRVAHVLALGPATADISRNGRLYVVSYSATVRGKPRAERFATAYRTKREADRAKAQADHIELHAFADYLNRVDRARAYIARRAERRAVENPQLGFAL